MWNDFLAAIALMLVLEGILPFLNPGRFRQTLALVAQLKDSNLRTIGFITMMLGSVLLYVVR